MVKPVTYTYQALNKTYICAAQTHSGAGALTLNGSGLDAVSAGLNNPRVSLKTTGFQRPVSLTSTGNVSAANITIAGFDIRGAAVTETLSGPNANTVQTTANFYEIYTVSTDATLGTAVSVGIGSSGQSQWYKADYQLTPTNIGFGATVSGTDLTYTIVQTTYNVESGEPPANAIINNADSAFVSATTSGQGNYILPFNALRCNIASSNGGNLTLDIYEAGIT